MSRSNKPAKETPPLPTKIVIDACVILNLHATGRIQDILASLPSKYLVSSYVRGEALWHYAPSGPEDGASEKCLVDLEPLIRSAVIEVVELTDDEQASFVEFARHLGDGEAACGALAIGRSAAVATDDHKAQRLFDQRIPGVTVLNTVALLRAWEVRSTVRRSELADALCAIRRGARFEPSGGEDEVWWKDRIRGTS